MEINDHPQFGLPKHCFICGSELCWICVEDLHIRSLQHKADFVNWIRVKIFGREVSICGEETCRTALHELNAKNFKLGWEFTAKARVSEGFRVFRLRLARERREALERVENA